MAILKKDFIRWYNQHSMGSKIDVAWAAVKMAEAVEGVQTQTINSQSKQCTCINSCVATIYICKDCGGRVNHK